MQSVYQTQEFKLPFYQERIQHALKELDGDNKGLWQTSSNMKEGKMLWKNC